MPNSEASNQLHLKGKVPEVISVVTVAKTDGQTHEAQVIVKSNLAPEKNHKIRLKKERRPASVPEAEIVPEKITLEVQ